MKSNIIKYIFIAFVVGILAFAIYFLNSNNNQEDENNHNSTVQYETTQMITNIRLGISDFDSINPIISQNREVLNISTLIFEPLLTLTSDYKTQYCLAKEIAKSDATTYVVKLNENVSWSDGSTLTAKDVQFTIDKIKENKSSVYGENVARIKSVEVIDYTTLKIFLDKEVPFFEYNLTFPIISYNQYNEKDLKEDIPISTGMYKITSLNGDKIELVKNEKWRNINTTNPKIDKITVNLYKSAGEIFNAFKLENVDIVNTSKTNIEDYVGTMGYNKKQYEGREYDFLALNCDDTVLQYKEVRQAINYAIDKENIVASIYNNNYAVADFPLDYGHYLYPEDSEKIEYNREKAKQVLEDAGWVYKYGEWRKTENYRTRTIDLTIIVDSTNENRVKVAKLIEKQLESIGINVYVNDVTKSGYERRLKQKDYEIILTGVYNSYSPDLTYFYGEDNLANFENEEMNNLLNEVKSIADENMLKEKYKNIINISKDEAAYIGLYRNKNTVISGQGLMGEITPNNYTTYYNLYNWYRQ